MGLVAVEKTNQLKNTPTEVLRSFMDAACLLPEILVGDILDTCLQVAEELNVRENVDDDIVSMGVDLWA